MSKDLNIFKNSEWFSYHDKNSYTTGYEDRMKKRGLRWLRWIFVLLLLFIGAVAGFTQTNSDNTFTTNATFVPTIKDAVKFSELPEIKDSTKKIKNINYGINSNPLFPKYQVEAI